MNDPLRSVIKKNNIDGIDIDKHFTQRHQQRPQRTFSRRSLALLLFLTMSVSSIVRPGRWMATAYLTRRAMHSNSKHCAGCKYFLSSSLSSSSARYVSSMTTTPSATHPSTTASTPSTTTTLDASSAVQLSHMDFSTNDTHNDHHNSNIPVVFLHGLLGSKRNFASIGRSLSLQLERKRRIVGVDLRNHGENHHDWRDEMDYHQMANDVAAFMDSQQMEKAVLVGHSMGGKVAQALALLQPHRVDGLVVLDIAPVTYTPKDAHWKAVQDIIHTLQSIQLGESVTKQDIDVQLRKAIPDPALRAFCLTNLDTKTGRWKIHLEGIAKELDRLAAFDVGNGSSTDDTETVERQYEGDAFFIHGGQSKFVRHSYMGQIAQYFPNHLLTTVKGAGHWIHAEAPDDTVALLKRFLDR